jgi:2OG-Fe(II) oxygenase superfamily
MQRGPFLPPIITTDILTTIPIQAETLTDGDVSSPDSLFDDDEPTSSSPPPGLSAVPPKLPGARTIAAASLDEEEDGDPTRVPTTVIVARRRAPPIPGLFFDPDHLLPHSLADSIFNSCVTSFFSARSLSGGSAEVNQVMLFSRAGHEREAFPPFLCALLEATSELLSQHPALPRDIHELLFSSVYDQQQQQQQEQQQEGEQGTQSRARQAIINLYRPGEGIAPHVDLLNRFGDGIVGVSLGGGMAMRFERAQERKGDESDGRTGPYEVWLPPRSVLVLTGEARYEWTHGIAPRSRDRVQVEDHPGRPGSASDSDSDSDLDSGSGWQWLERGLRVSVTFRWLLPGAEIVGGCGFIES